MKTSYRNFGILALMLAAASWAGAPSFAQQHDEHGEHQHEHGGHEEEGEHHEGGHYSDTAIPETAHEIVAEIFARDLMIRDFIETGRLIKIHEPAFAAKALVESLVEMGHSNHESGSAAKLSAASKRLGASAKLLDKYGDAGDAAKTNSTYKIFGAAIKDIRALYPDVTPKNYWTCSMHPDVRKAASGSCPQCKMKLIEKGQSHDGGHDEHGHSEGHEDDH